MKEMITTYLHFTYPIYKIWFSIGPSRCLLFLSKYVTEKNVSSVHFVQMFAFHMYVTGKNASTVQFVRMFAFYIYVTEKYTSVIQKLGALGRRYSRARLLAGGQQI